MGPTVISLVTLETTKYFIVNFMSYCALRLVELQFQKSWINVKKIFPFSRHLSTEKLREGHGDLVLKGSELGTLLGQRAHALGHINCFENFNLWPPYSMQHIEFPLRNKLQEYLN